ncbi:uncharacterized protein LOC125499961 [Athalia rosae]|uniref:uncharacterized protein LOC125499961 n=1 Tax=Athalia rosae TaxID=37344 RepID=UPI002033391E|nr:uncharacterized protein LOC125499961 [Athalia rosae]
MESISIEIEITLENSFIIIIFTETACRKIVVLRVSTSRFMNRYGTPIHSMLRVEEFKAYESCSYYTNTGFFQIGNFSIRYVITMVYLQSRPTVCRGLYHRRQNDRMKKKRKVRSWMQVRY